MDPDDDVQYFQILYHQRIIPDKSFQLTDIACLLHKSKMLNFLLPYFVFVFVFFSQQLMDQVCLQ